jgi:bacterial/archaeal transporter family protein
VITVLSWQTFTIGAILIWGAVGYVQKISANLLGPESVVFWGTIGYVIVALALLAHLPAHRPTLTTTVLLLGLSSGLLNNIANWFLYSALRKGAPASIAVPLTALYPLVTVLLALTLLHESLTLREGVGAMLAIAGGVLLSYERPEKKA